LEQVSSFGGEEFIIYLCSFLDYPVLRQTLCSLLHVLCFDVYRDLIVVAMQEHSDDRHVAITLELIGEKVDTRNNSLIEEEAASSSQRPRSGVEENKRARDDRKRVDKMREIQTSERTYCLALFTVAKIYLPNLKKLLSGAEVNAMFGSILEIHELHKQLVKEMDKEMKRDGGHQFGSLFLEFANSLHQAYFSYIRNNSKALAALAQKKKSSKKFRDEVWKTSKEIVRGGTLSLENYLKLPTQRVMTYEKMVRELNELTDEDHDDKELLEEALARLQEVAAELNPEQNNFRRSIVASQSLKVVKSKKERISGGNREEQKTSASLNNSFSSPSPMFVPKNVREKMGQDSGEIIRLTKHRHSTLGTSQRSTLSQSASRTPLISSMPSVPRTRGNVSDCPGP
jgi:hypothetical protein